MPVYWIEGQWPGGGGRKRNGITVQTTLKMRL